MTVQVRDITERPIVLLGWDINRTVYPTGVAGSEAVGTAQANTAITVPGIAPTGVVGTAQVNASVGATGVAAGTGDLGSPSITVSVQPTAIADPDSLGDPVLNVTAPVYGAAPSGGLGSPTAFTSMNPSSATTTGGAGSPSVNLVMSPDGIASTEVFGDADTLATVFIIPGPVDPSNDFGVVQVVRKGWLFRTPRTTYQWRIPPFKEYEGISLLREAGVWSEVQHPDLERTRAADVYLGGGRDHFVDDTVKTELVALGYTVTEEIIP